MWVHSCRTDIITVDSHPWTDPGQTAEENLYADQGGFLPALANLYLAGIKIIDGILDNWDTTFESGVNGKYFQIYTQNWRANMI